MKKVVFLAVLTVMGMLGSRAQAQMIIDTWSFDTGVDTTLWIDIDGVDSTILAGPMTTGRSGQVPIGFPFKLGPATHTVFSVNVNGTVHFGTSLISTYQYFNEPLSNNYNNNGNCPKVEPFGWRGRFDGNSYTRYALVGDSGSRVLVIETRMTGQYWASGTWCTFQVQLMETGGLRMVFGDAVDDAASGAVQMQNGIATANSSDKDAIFIDYGTHEAVRWDWVSYDGRNNSTWPEKGRWYMVEPDSNYCPYPPSVSVGSTDPTSVTFTTSGNGSDMRLRVAAVGVDTLWPAGQSSFVVTTPFNPSAEYTATVQNVCDDGKMSYRVREKDFVTGCGEVVYLPWQQRTQGSRWACWDYSQYTSETNRWKVSNISSAMLYCGTTTEQTYNEWLLTPVFNLPDTNGLTLQWNYEAQLLDGVAPTVEMRVATCSADGTVDSTSWTLASTYNREYAYNTPCYLNLDAWRGQRVCVAFVRTGTGGSLAYVSNYRLYLQHEPMMEFLAPAVVHVGDTTVLTATMLAGADSSVVWTWHSVLLDSTWVMNGFNGTNGQSVLNIVYPAVGFDTITVVLTTAYGADTIVAAVDVVDCSPVTTFPWSEDFVHSIDCWQSDGWQNYTGSGVLAITESGEYEIFRQLVYCNNNVGKYMLSKPITLPATGMENMALWIECDPAMMVRLSPTASTDTADFTDTLLTIPALGNENNFLWYTADLEPYAGQTVRVGFFKIDGGQQAYVNTLRIDYDTLPRLWQLTAPAKSATDSTIVCTATLRRGSADGLTYTWHSSLMDTTVTLSSLSYSSTWSLQYDRGGVDTITVIAANDYGADTLVKTVRVKDCYPATLPWKEDFQDGDICWYKNAISKWYDAIPYGNSAYEHLRHLYLNVKTDTSGSWIMSKQIQIPADTNLHPRLFWKVASSNRNYQHLYSVMVSTDEDRTDYSEYYVVYVDSSTHVNFSNYDQLSVDLTQYAGQNIYVAFVNAEWHMASSAIGLYIDDVEIRATAIPRITLVADGSDYYFGDTATYTVTLEEGSNSNLVYTWHSTLLDSSWTSSNSATCSLNYGLANGFDTVTVIATNAYGSDTATVVVNSVVITQPAVMDFTADEMDFFMGEDRAEVDDTVVYVITRNRCVSTGLTYSLHSTLLDTTVTVATSADTCRITLAYPEAGYDTITAFIYNVYSSSDTSTLWLDVQDCPVVSVPFFENFDHLGEEYEYIPCWPGYCWLYPFGDESNLGASFRGVGAHEYLITPAIDLPADTLGLQLSWFTYFGSNYHTYLPARILVSPTGSKDIADFTETLFYGNVPVDAYDTLSLDAYRGQRIRLAFGYSGYQLVFDDIRIDYDRSAPEVALTAPATVYTRTDVPFAATLIKGSRQGLVCTWQSTHGTVTGSGDSVTVYYSTPGIDTLTVIVANAYGADTATLVLEAIGQPLPEFTFGHPVSAEVGESAFYGITLNDCSRIGLNVTLHSTLLDSTFAMEDHNSNFTLDMLYPYGGVDTVVVTASNIDGTVSDTAVVTVVDCSPRAVPYVEDFELVPATSATAAGNLPGCWTYSWNGSNAAYGPHVITSSGYQYISGLSSNALFMVAGSSTGYGNLAEVVLPRFADSLQLLSIAFDYRFETASNGTLWVGYRDSAGNFTPVEALPGHAGSYLRDTVTFADVTNPNGRIALRWEYGSVWYAVVIDNLEVFIDNNIPAPTVTVDAITDISAHVTWTAVPDATAYHLVVNGTAIDTLVTGLSFDLTGLTPSTTYAVQVNAIVDSVSGHIGSAQFTTPCIILHLPFFTDFSDVAAGSLPVCWAWQWSAAPPAAPPQVNTDGYLQMGAGGYYNGDYRRDCYLTLPHTDAALNSAMFAIQYHCQNSGYGTLNVGYMNGNSFVSVASLPNQGTTVRRDTVNLYNFPDGITQLTLNWHGDWYGPYYIYIHELSIFDDGAIRTPRNLHVENVSGQCVSLAWDPVDGASAYHVTLAGVIDTVVSDTTVSFCGLTSNTQYTVNVAGMTADDTGRYAHLTFTTACSIIGLPWFEDFEGSSPLQCWSHLGGGGIQLPQSGYDSYYAAFCHSGSKGLQIHNNYSNTPPAYAVTPIIEVPGNELLVSFWANHFEEGGMTLEAGVLTVPGDTASFVPLMTCPLSSSPARFEFDTRGVTSNYLSVAFRMTGTTSGIIVDDITIERLTPCARLRSVDSYALDARTAVVEWQYDSASTEPNTGALVILTDLSDATAAPVTVTATGNSHTFSGLAFGHRYQVSVQALCENDTAMALTTVVVPSGNVCDQRLGSNNNDWSVINCERPYSYSQTLYPAVLAASVDTLFGVAYHITSTGVARYPSSNNTYSTGPRLIDVYIGQTTSNSLTSPVSVATHTLAVQNYELSVADTGWVRINFTNPVPLDGVSNLIVTVDDNTGAIYGDVYFSHHNDDIGTFYQTSSASYNYTQTYDPYNPTSFSPNTMARFPDIQLLGGCSTERCLQPIIAVTEEDTHSISLGWQQRGAETLWQVEYRVEGDSLWIVADTTSATAYTITGLNAATGYNVRVSTLCADETIPSAVVRTHTLCGVVGLPYHQTFRATWLGADVGGVTGAVPCWDLGNNNLLSQGRGLWNTNQNGDYIVSPEIGSQLGQVSVRLEASGSVFFLAGLKVGVCDADGGNLTWIDTITLVNEATPYTVYLTGYDGAARHIAIGGSHESWTLYDVVVNLITECQPVHHVSLGQIDDTSVTIHWPPVDTASSWAVYVDDSLVGVTGDTVFALGDLVPGTSYTIGVREICWAGDTAVATTLAVSMPCSVTLPWTENFDDGVDQQMPLCWYPVFRPQIGSILNAYILGAGSNPYLYFYDYYSPYHNEDTAANYLSSPVFYAGGRDVQVNFVSRRSSSSADAVFQAGIMTNPADTSSFIPLLTIPPTSNDVAYQFTTEGLTLPDKYTLAFRSYLASYARVDNISVDFLAIPTYTVTLAVNDTAMGTVTGTGTYEEGSTVTLTATANEGYHFVEWSDSVTVPVREIVVTADIALTAFFAADSMPTPPPPDTVWRTVTVVCDSTMGTVSGAGIYEDSSLVILAATAYEGYHFVEWSDSDTNAVRQILVTSDTSFTAYFAQDSLPTPPPPDTVWRTVTVTSNVSGPCQTYGSGRYPDGESVEIGYTLLDTVGDGGHWELLGWEDGATDNPRQVVVTSDTTFKVLFRWVQDPVGIDEVDSEKLKVEIYPNPATTEVTIKVSEPSTITILDMTGRIVECENECGSDDTNTLSYLNVSTLSSGTYFVRISTGNKSTVKKLIIQ